MSEQLTVVVDGTLRIVKLSEWIVTVRDYVIAYMLEPNQTEVVAVVGEKEGMEYETCPKGCLLGI